MAPDDVIRGHPSLKRDWLRRWSGTGDGLGLVEGVGGLEGHGIAAVDGAEAASTDVVAVQVDALGDLQLGGGAVGVADRDLAVLGGSSGPIDRSFAGVVRAGERGVDAADVPGRNAGAEARRVDLPRRSAGGTGLHGERQPRRAGAACEGVASNRADGVGQPGPALELARRRRGGAREHGARFRVGQRRRAGLRGVESAGLDRPGGRGGRERGRGTEAYRHDGGHAARGENGTHAHWS